jgi:signal transduction histidine kinase
MNNFVSQNVIVLTIIIGLPLLSWVVTGPRRTQYSLLYLLGTGFFAAAAAVFLFKSYLPTFWVPTTIRTLVYSAILLLNEFVRHAIDKKRRFDIALWASAVVAVPLSVMLEIRFGEIGIIVHHSFMVLLQGTVLSNISALYRQAPSRGVISMGAAMTIVLLTNISQIVSAAAMGVLLTPSLEGFSGLMVYLSNILWVMLFSIGYWSYTVDTTKRAEIAAEIAYATELQKRKTAESLAAEMAQIVGERDELIMMNSRFEALNNVGVFNAAVIHELSQPVQKMLTKIEYLSHQSIGLDERLQKTLREIHGNATVTSEIIHAVRSLLVDSSAPVSFVTASEVLSVVRPIAESQAIAERIWLSIVCDDFPSNSGVLVNPILLNRVILNLVSNALNALRDAHDQPGFSRRRMEIRVINIVADQARFLQIEVWDSGVGFPKMFDPTFRTISKNGNPSGMGLGLVISRQIIATWKGSMAVSQRDGGKVVSFSIPLVQQGPAGTARA